ncbi:MAG: VanZ family protein [Methylocystis silviterrae]|uniref:VanZ family protein n=1 Tax=Methylocystis silviterrae TaxID=2743612 RepID=UPI003C7127D9
MSGLQLFYSKRRELYRLALGSCLVAIIVLSLVPGEVRPQTGAPGEFEHFIAYMGTGLFVAARYRSLRPRLALWAATAALSFVLEFMQKFVPGREPDIFDALASLSGLTLGVLLGGLIISTIHRWRRDFVDETVVEPAE